MLRNCVRLKKLCAFLSAVTLLAFFSASVFSQTPCISDDDVKKMLAAIDSPPPDTELNKKLRDELIKMKAESIRLNQEALSANSQNNKTREEAAKNRAKNEAELCRIFQHSGWLTKKSVGADGVSAALFLIRTSFSPQSLKQILPVLNLAIKKNEIEKNEDLAGLIDLLFLRSGQKQFFGTQVTVSDGFLVLAPLLSEAKVDEWRKLYNMPPLNEYISYIQSVYRMPLIKSPSLPVRETAKSEKEIKEIDETDAGNLLGDSNAESEVIRVDTGLVNLNVGVFGKDSKTATGVFEEKDFKIYEDGQEQEISFFARSETPFDLVLVLDLSGSTADKIGLIRASTRRFIEAKRPVDRLAIVTFSFDAKIVSPLTNDSALLFEAAKKIEGRGGSNVWDALKFTLENVFEKNETGRQRAVVFMTDGEESALLYYPGYGSKTLFADLLEKVRLENTVIIPIYLENKAKDAESSRMQRDARNTLGLLAKESGGTFYKAQKIEDLNGVYEQVLNDLSKTYSIGYVPENEKRDGSWRTIKVEIPSRPELIVKTKTGYYAK